MEKGLTGRRLRGLVSRVLRWLASLLPGIMTCWVVWVQPAFVVDFFFWVFESLLFSLSSLPFRCWKKILLVMLSSGCYPDLLLSGNTMYPLNFLARVFLCVREYFLHGYISHVLSCFLLSDSVVHVHAIPPTRVTPLHISFWKLHGYNIPWDFFETEKWKNFKMFLSCILQKKWWFFVGFAWVHWLHSAVGSAVSQAQFYL